MAEMTRFWWVRHAPGIGPGLIGATDVPADLSHTMAISETRARLPGNALVVTSGMRRARETCTALGRRPLSDASALHEQDFGDWEGLDWETIGARYTEAANAFWADPAGARPPGGESFETVMARVAGWIGAAPDEPDLLIVAHAGPVRAAVAMALDLSPATALRLEIAPLSITRLERLRTEDGVHWRVGMVNCGGVA